MNVKNGQIIGLFGLVELNRSVYLYFTDPAFSRFTQKSGNQTDRSNKLNTKQIQWIFVLGIQLRLALDGEVVICSLHYRFWNFILPSMNIMQKKRAVWIQHIILKLLLLIKNNKNCLCLHGLCSLPSHEVSSISRNG